VILKVEGLRFRYNSHPVLEGIEFQVEKGEVCTILGNNGAGKSTLLRCLARILRTKEGMVCLDGQDITRLSGQDLARRLGYVAQRGGESARLTVFDAVLQGRKPHLGWAVRSNDLRIVHDVLDALEMGQFSFRHLDQLSGGELQKVMIARALAQEPELLLLDEPTSNLDMRNQLEVMGLVRRMSRERGMVVLVAIHDINLALRFSDKYLVLHDGVIFASGGEEALTESSIEETYGVKVRLVKDQGKTLVVPEGPVGGVEHGAEW